MSEEAICIAADFVPADPIVAKRPLAWPFQDGDDDMFSADLTAKERHARLGHMACVPTAAFLSGADEFVLPPERGGPVPEALAEMLRAAMVSAPPLGDTSADSGAGVRSGREGSYFLWSYWAYVLFELLVFFLCGCGCGAAAAAAAGKALPELSGKLPI